MLQPSDGLTCSAARSRPVSIRVDYWLSIWRPSAAHLLALRSRSGEWITLVASRFMITASHDRTCRALQPGLHPLKLGPPLRFFTLTMVSSGVLIFTDWW